MLRSLFLLLAVLQDGPPAIEFPEGVRPQPTIEEAPTPPPVDEFSVDELYLIQSDIALHVIPSPPGVVQVTPVKSGSVIFSRFAGGKSLEERQVERPHGYVLRGVTLGSVELIVLPAGSQDLGEMRRRTLTVRQGAQQEQQQQPKPTDDVGKAFADYERMWRSLQRDLADRLDRGEITSEDMAHEWFGTAGQDARRIAFTPIAQAEAAAFGGEKWTAKAHAAYIRRYVNAGK
jgi:hypothetical protein